MLFSQSPSHHPFSLMTKKLSACPSWLDLSQDRRSFVFVPRKAEIVRKIFDLCIAGLGSYSIAKQLERENVTAFGSSGKWDNTTIDNLLRSRAVLGEYQPKSYAGGSKKGVPVGEPVPNYYPAVVDERVFAEAQRARQRHLASGRGRKGNGIANLFSGLTTCAYCGSIVKFHSNGLSKSLICDQVLRKAGCIRAGWSYKNFERSALSFISHPALIDSASNETQQMMKKLVSQISLLQDDDPLNARLQLSLSLRSAVSELKLSSAGENPVPTHSDALIRRDHPGRFFEIRLWNGRLYRARPADFP